MVEGRDVDGAGVGAALCPATRLGPGLLGRDVDVEPTVVEHARGEGDQIVLAEAIGEPGRAALFERLLTGFPPRYFVRLDSR